MMRSRRLGRVRPSGAVDCTDPFLVTLRMVSKETRTRLHGPVRVGISPVAFAGFILSLVNYTCRRQFTERAVLCGDERLLIEDVVQTTTFNSVPFYRACKVSFDGLFHTSIQRTEPT